MRSKKPTEKQQKVLDYISSYIDEKGFPPSISEIQAKFSIKSPTGAVDHLKALERKGLITRIPNISRGIRVVGQRNLFDSVKFVSILGTIAAGTPLFAEQNIIGQLPIPQEVAGGAECFALRVKGDSMIDAGIYNGDYVIARVQNTAKNGEIVVALIGDEATVKYLYIEEGSNQIRLQPANDTMGPLYVNPAEVQIQGKVIAVYRFLN